MKPIPKWSRVLGWIFGVFFLIGSVGDVASGNHFSALIGATISATLIPQIRALACERTGIELPLWSRALLLVVLVTSLGAVQPDRAVEPIASNRATESSDEPAAENTPDRTVRSADSNRRDRVLSETSRGERSRSEATGVVSPITFEEVHRQFSIEGNLTDLQKDHAWRAYRGKCVEWRGELTYMDEGFLGGITIGFRHRRDTLTYDVLVTAPGSLKETLLEWRQGNNYRYRVTLEDYPGVIMPITAAWGCGD